MLRSRGCILERNLMEEKLSTGHKVSHGNTAGLQQNIGKNWGPSAWKEMTGSSPNKVFCNTAELSAKKASNEKKRKSTEEVKTRRRMSKYSRTGESSEARKSRHDDGLLPEEIDDDISPEYLEELKKKLL